MTSDRLELALRASNEGIWDWNLQESTIYYSRRILEFFECSEKNAPNIFVPPHIQVHASDRQTFTESLEEALQIGGPETLAVDARIQTGSDGWRWLRIRGTVVRNREGIATRIAGSMIDISFRKAAEEQIEEERHLLRSLIDHVPLQIYFKDLNSQILLANRGMAEWHGYEKSEDLIGKHDRDLFANEHWNKAESDEQEIIRTGVPINGKLEQETWREGDETYVVTSKFPWRDKSGSIKGTFGVSSDVTALVNAQRQTQELAEQLQRKNASYEEEVQLARGVQQALVVSSFPSLRAPDGTKIDFASRYLPISGLAGDFYEILPLTDNRYGVFICDVMGHGIRAALIVSVLRGLIATHDTKEGNPALFLQTLNGKLTAILSRAKVTMFATAFYGILDLDTHTFQYACAGHPGPIIVSKDTSSQICTNKADKGPALGLLNDAVYTLEAMNFSTISKILLFTDGITEAEDSKGRAFDVERLIDAAKKTCTLEPWLDHILETVLDFSDDHHFADDVCLLGIEIN